MPAIVLPNTVDLTKSKTGYKVDGSSSDRISDMSKKDKPKKAAIRLVQITRGLCLYLSSVIQFPELLFKHFSRMTRNTRHQLILPCTIICLEGYTVCETYAICATCLQSFNFEKLNF